MVVWGVFKPNPNFSSDVMQSLTVLPSPNLRYEPLPAFPVSYPSINCSPLFPNSILPLPAVPPYLSNFVIPSDVMRSLSSMPNSSEYGISLVGGNAEFGLHKDGSGNYKLILGTYQGSIDIPLVFRTGNRAERIRIDSSGRLLVAKTSGDHIVDINATNSEVKITKTSFAAFTGIQLDRDASGTNGGYLGLAGASGHYANQAAQHDIILRSQARLLLAAGGADARVMITSEGNVGIARTTNNHQTSSTSPTYDLRINRESSAATHDGFNKSLNVDNQYTVSTFRSTHINRHGTNQWYDIAKFVAWDFTGRIYVQSGGTFTGDQIVIDITSSYNSALGNSKSGPIVDVRRTEGHNGGRFTKVKVGCHNSNRQPIVQIYHSGDNTHNAGSWVNVTVHDYGSAYGGSSHRGEARFQAATTLNETWAELDIANAHCNYYNTSTTPAFSAAKMDDANQVASGVYKFNSQVLDRGGDNYSTTTGRFTCPCDGVYYFIASIQLYGQSNGVHARFQKNGTDIYNNGTSSPVYDEKAGSHGMLTLFALVECSTSDYIEVVRNNTTRGMQSAVAGFLVR